MVNKMKHVVVDETTFNLIRTQCKQELIRTRPELKGCFISDNHVIRQMIIYYLPADDE